MIRNERETRIPLHFPLDRSDRPETGDMLVIYGRRVQADL
jgi:hypothetical protein